MKITSFFTTLIAVTLPALLLSACVSSERLAEMERQRQYQQQAEARAFAQRLANKCDGFGFRRGTTEFSQCLQQAEQQELLNNAVQMQQNQINQQNQQRHFRASQCYASGRFDCY